MKSGPAVLKTWVRGLALHSVIVVLAMHIDQSILTYYPRVLPSSLKVDDWSKTVAENTAGPRFTFKRASSRPFINDFRAVVQSPRVTAASALARKPLHCMQADQCWCWAGQDSRGLCNS